MHIGSLMNRYELQLRLVHLELELDPVRRVLAALSGVVRSSGERIECALGFNEEYGGIVQDQECDVIENIIGTAFVVGQGFITTTVSGIYKLHEYHSGNGNVVRLESSLDAPPYRRHSKESANQYFAFWSFPPVSPNPLEYDK